MVIATCGLCMYICCQLHWHGPQALPPYICRRYGGLVASLSCGSAFCICSSLDFRKRRASSRIGLSWTTTPLHHVALSLPAKSQQCKLPMMCGKEHYARAPSRSSVHSLIKYIQETRRSASYQKIQTLTRRGLLLLNSSWRI